jgi:hypothetical protein
MSTSTPTAAFPITEDDVRAALERILGEERGEEVWRDACDAVQIPRPGPELGPEELTRIIEHLKERSGSASVVGNSLSVKIRTHKHRSG